MIKRLTIEDTQTSKFRDYYPADEIDSLLIDARVVAEFVVSLVDYQGWGLQESLDSAARRIIEATDNLKSANETKISRSGEGVEHG